MMRFVLMKLLLGVRGELVMEEKRKRGRPKKSTTKRNRINLLVTDEFHKELKELSELEGVTMTDYIIDSVRLRGNLTKATKGDNSQNTAELELYPDEDYMDYEYD